MATYENICRVGLLWVCYCVILYYSFLQHPCMWRDAVRSSDGLVWWGSQWALVNTQGVGATYCGCIISRQCCASFDFGIQQARQNLPSGSTMMHCYMHVLTFALHEILIGWVTQQLRCACAQVISIASATHIWIKSSISLSSLTLPWGVNQKKTMSWPGTSPSPLVV